MFAKPVAERVAWRQAALAARHRTAPPPARKVYVYESSSPVEPGRHCWHRGTHLGLRGYGQRWLLRRQRLWWLWLSAETVYYQNDPYYSRPGSTIYVENDRYYRDRDRERDRDRQARERERERDRQARDRERDQRARDADRRRDLERQARERDRNNRDRNQGGLFGRSSSHQAECDRYANQVRSGGDIVNTPSRPC